MTLNPGTTGYSRKHGYPVPLNKNVWRAKYPVRPNFMNLGITHNFWHTLYQTHFYVSACSCAHERTQKQTSDHAVEWLQCRLKINHKKTAEKFSPSIKPFQGVFKGVRNY